MIRWLREIGDQEFSLIGGKGFNLARLRNAGIAVPNGFIVTTTAYDTYLQENRLEEKIAEQMTSSMNMEEASDAIQRLFDVEKVSEVLKREIFEAFQTLGSKGVAVRSSATIEDLPGMSFAGQYSTYLNVTESELLEKIVACWRSLWNLRAMEYRKKNGVVTGFSHAVVVQEMVESVVSGVVFTANPMNGLRHQLVINASFGLGEAIVSGEVQPDQFIFDRKSKTVLSSACNEKRIKYVFKEQGIEVVEVEEEQVRAASMNTKQIEVLAREAEKAEVLFGKPQDLEFAFDAADQLFIVQSRDITTLYPIDALEQDGKLRGYMSAGTVLLGMKEPFTPLGYDLMSNMFPTIINVMTSRKKNPLTNHFVSYAGNRIFVDMTLLLSNGFIAKQFASAFSGNDLPLKGVMEQMLADYGKQFRKQGIHFRLPLGIFRYAISMVSGMRRIMKIPNALRYAAMIEEGNRWYSEIVPEYEKSETTQERLDFSLKALTHAFQLSQAQAMYCLDANKYQKIEKVLNKHFGTAYKVETLAQSLPGCVTQTLAIRLNEYAQHCDERGIGPMVEDPEFQAILKKYGSRANMELDFGTMRWREDPTYLLDLTRSYMTEQMYKRNLEDVQNKEQEALDLIAEVSDRLNEKIGKRRAEKFRKLMINYRFGAAMREYPKFDIVRFLDLARQSIQGIGDELVTKGELDERNDVFFLHRSEILEGEELRARVQRAKAKYDVEMKRTSIPRMILNNGHTYYSSNKIDPKAKVIQGMPLSAGVYEGRIRIVWDPRTAILNEGEILVTESTNPSWTPLFAVAGALIMEYGGPMSHGGIVAREYGIPAVVGIPSAGEILKNGQWVRINGETGTIEILEDHKPE